MSTDPAYFTRMYEGSDDPWGFRSRWYERRKRDLTLAALPEEQYGSAFEPGCSVGMLTRALAPRCAYLDALDTVPAAVDRARREVAGFDHVRVEQGRVPLDWPEGTFDLVVLSEDPTAVSPERIGGLEVLATIVGGELRYGTI